MELPEFKPWRSIPRLERECIVTEKLDGTNGIIYISEDLSLVLAGSRNRWLLPDQPDNYNFRAWVKENEEDLKKLGPGYHYGEYWGAGIARRYNQDKKRFSLFDTRWADQGPECCDSVPVLGECNFTEVHALVREKMGMGDGQFQSIAAPGFMNPEGFVVLHKPSLLRFKFTFGGDGHKALNPNQFNPKWADGGGAAP